MRAELMILGSDSVDLQGASATTRPAAMTKTMTIMTTIPTGTGRRRLA
jgi:hypothetical protein